MPLPIQHHYLHPFSPQTLISSDQHQDLPSHHQHLCFLNPLAELASRRLHECPDSESSGSFGHGYNTDSDANSCIDVRSPGSSSLDWQISLSRCSSTGSIVTDDVSERVLGDQAERDKESTSEAQWTDDKHRTYLTLMEENFVKDLYDREYCAVDVCGQEPCSHSDANSANSQLFKSWRNGYWQWRTIPKRLRSPYILLQNPWINHFRHPTSSHSPLPSNNYTIPHENHTTFDSRSPSTSHTIIPCYPSATSCIDKSSDRSDEEEDRKANSWNPDNMTSFLNSRKRGVESMENAELRICTRQRVSDGQCRWRSDGNEA